MRVAGPILALIVLGACRHPESGGGVQYVVRVDHRLDKTGAALIHDPPPDASYRAVEAFDAYALVVDGDSVRITPLGDLREAVGAKDVVIGHRMASADGEERFSLDSGLFAGGRLILRGDRAELTVFGSGVPVIASDRGALVRR